MKSLKLMFVLFVTLSFFSCNNDDDNNQADELSAENFVGVYNVTRLETTESETQDGATIDFYTTVASDLDLTWTFNADGTHNIQGSYTITETGTEDGEEFSDTYEIDLDNNGSYSINESSEEINFSFSSADDLDDIETATYEVVSFNSSTVVLQFEEFESFEGEDYQYTIEIRLERQ